MFKRKHEFRPDKTESGTLNKLYITKKQRTKALKWVLMILALVTVCVTQDVVLSRLRLWGATFDLMAATLLLVCILQDPEIGSIFVLAASAVYSFSGSAPGYYVIALLTVIGVFFAIVRHCYLHTSFGSTMLCTAAAIAIYEMALFGIALFFGYTTITRLTDSLVKTGLSVAAMPLMYPIFTAICKIGGETWND